MRARFRTYLLIALAVAAGPMRGLAGDYFVAPTGDNAQSGDSESPFRTIGHGVSLLEAGDSLIVTPGTYAESIVIARAGAAGAPITIRGLPGAVLINPEPGMSHSAVDIHAPAAHVIVQGFEITGGFAESVFVRPGSRDIELAALDVHHNHAGIWIAGAQRVIVRDTAVHHNARSGIRIFADARDVTLTDVRSEYHDDGEGCAGDADGISVEATVSNLELVRVQANYNAEDGLDVSARDVQMRAVESRGNACSGVKLGGGGRLQNMLITGSRIGLNISGSAAMTTTLESSTVLDNGIGIRALGAHHLVAVYNSIVSGAGKALQVNADIALHEHHNIFYRPDSTSRLIVRTIIGGELLYSGADVNAGRWQVASGGQGTGTIAVDPELDATGRPLDPHGPAIDSGDAALSPTIDLAGATRPAGLGVERGAFEYQPASASASVSRVVIRGKDDGSGEVRLSLTLTLPADPPLDVSSAPVHLIVRGSGGTVMKAEIDDANSSGRAAGDYRRRVRFRRTGSERVTVVLRQSRDVVRVSLRAAGVDLAALQDENLWVDIVAGDLVATAHAPLRYGSGHLLLP